MREIKFRAWDKRFKNMSFGSGDLLLRINDTDYTEPMQYTGLKDKNGVEIYEGDVVRVEIPNYINDFVEAIVEFNSGAFGIRVVGNPVLNNAVGQFKSFNKNTTGLEIIGNIYQNTELLK